MTFARFEHPATDGSHDWTVLAFEDGKQVGGYIAPSRFSDGKFRAYIEARPTRSMDFTSAQECIEFVKAGLK